MVEIFTYVGCRFMRRNNSPFFVFSFISHVVLFEQCQSSTCYPANIRFHPFLERVLLGLSSFQKVLTKFADNPMKERIEITDLDLNKVEDVEYFVHQNMYYLSEFRPKVVQFELCVISIFILLVLTFLYHCVQLHYTFVLWYAMTIFTVSDSQSMLLLSFVHFVFNNNLWSLFSL